MTNTKTPQHSLQHTDSCLCPVVRAAHLVGDVWTLLIVRDLLDGCKRFGQLKDSLGNVSPKTLTQRLKMLEQAGLVVRHAYTEIPPRVEYSLTETGMELLSVIEALREFGEKHLGESSC